MELQCYKEKKPPTAYCLMLTALFLCHFDGLKNSEVGRHNAMFSKRTFSIKSQESRVKNAKKKYSYSFENLVNYKT